MSYGAQTAYGMLIRSYGDFSIDNRYVKSISISYEFFRDDDQTNRCTYVYCGEKPYGTHQLLSLNLQNVYFNKTFKIFERIYYNNM